MGWFHICPQEPEARILNSKPPTKGYLITAMFYHAKDKSGTGLGSFLEFFGSSHPTGSRAKQISQPTASSSDCCISKQLALRKKAEALKTDQGQLLSPLPKQVKDCCTRQKYTSNQHRCNSVDTYWHHPLPPSVSGAMKMPWLQRKLSSLPGRIDPCVGQSHV